MTKKLVTEEDLRKRLLKNGKSVDEIDTLIGKHIDATSSPAIDTDAISELLRKAQHDSALRVLPFKLAKEQYDSLASYFDDASTTRPGSEVDASYLVQRTLEEFINLIG